MAEVSEMARALKAMREAANLTVQQVADAVGMPKSTYAAYEDKYKGLLLPVLLVKKLDAVFTRAGIDRDRIWSLAGVAAPLAAVATVADIPVNKVVDKPEDNVAGQNKGNVTYLRERNLSGPRDLPIRGHVRAGRTGFFIDQGETRGFAMRPESLRGVDDAYAVRVHDDCMAPRYEPGEVLQVDPFRQAKPGDVVIIQLHDDQAFVKFLVRRGGGLVVCRQLNPAKEVEFPSAKVKSIHLVVGVDYLER